MKITDAVLILLGEAPKSADHMALDINHEERFAKVREPWTTVSADQVYAAMSGLRSKSKIAGNLIEPVSGRIGITETYKLTPYGEERLRLMCVAPQAPEPNKLTGGRVNYYLAQVEHPQREDQAPYRAECEDIIQALQMTFDEGCEFKAIWRTAAARLNNAKPGHQAVYDAEKRVHYATRSLKHERLKEQKNG